MTTAHPSRFERRHLKLVGGSTVRRSPVVPPIDTRVSLRSSLSSANTNLALAQLRGDESGTQAWSLSRRFLEDALRCLDAERQR